MATGRIPGPVGFTDTAGQLVNTRRPLGVAGTSALSIGSGAGAELFAASTAHEVHQLAKVLVGTPRKSASKVLGTSSTVASGERSREEFKAAVKEGQMRYLRIHKGRHPFDDVPDAELEVIEGKHRMRRAAAQACRALLADARAALGEGKTEKAAHALHTSAIGVHSAYRNYAEDSLAWRNTFGKWYDDSSAARAGLAGGPHGDAAVNLMVTIMKGKKAPPGWSNHSNGMAVDFTTTFGKHYYGTDSRDANRAAWRRTWLHPWLLANARQYGFKPLATEEWHWDFG